MEDPENIFTQEELDELIALHEGGNNHDLAFRIFQKAREKNNIEVPDEFFESNIAPQLEDVMDNPVFSILPSEQLIGVLYMSIEAGITQGEDQLEEE